MRKSVQVPVLGLIAIALVATAHLSVHRASAHVHAVTPLGQCTVDNAEHSGGRAILDTPSDAENGGPIVPGPIPLNTGNASFDPDTGGGNHGDPSCP